MKVKVKDWRRLSKDQKIKMVDASLETKYYYDNKVNVTLNKSA